MSASNHIGSFNGLGMNPGNLSRLSNAQTRSISAENFTGEPGKGGMATEGTGKNHAGDLGQGWKISPSIVVQPGETFTLADIDGSGAIQHIWMTFNGRQQRFYILRVYYENETRPAIECPVCDFFAMAWPQKTYAPLNSLMVTYNPRCAFNCYWEMPFRKNCRITITNLDAANFVLYYQIDYTLTDVPDDCAYFCCSFRRFNPLKYKDVVTVADRIRSAGHYVGTYLAWGVNNCGWWGEGEIKFYIDDDDRFPTICGTGTEDYFCGSYGFEASNQQGNRQYFEFSTAYAGMPQVIRPDGLYVSQQRFGLYRWHVCDPIRFRKKLKVTIQALGWHLGENGSNQYYPLQDDISATAFWYQQDPAPELPPLPEKYQLEIV